MFISINYANEYKNMNCEYWNHLYIFKKVSNEHEQVGIDQTRILKLQSIGRI